MRWHRARRRARRATPRPSLRFTARCWAKLIYLRDRGDSEIGAFGLSDADDPLLITDLLVVKQFCSPITEAFDDAAVADLFDELVDRGIPPERFTRVWVHTHPGACPLPSATDEATFRRVFGRMDWAVMAIVARGGARYARLAYHTGPGGAFPIPVRVAYDVPFEGTDWEAWEREYVERVVTTPFPAPRAFPEARGAAAAANLFALSQGEEEMDGGPTHSGPV